MSVPVLIVVAALTFGVCFLIDKGYTHTFRNHAQHKSGKAVRLSKRYAVFGLLLSIVGILAIFTGLKDGPVLLWGGVIVLLMGLGLVTYYMTFGIFYDDDSFIYTTFGKKSTTYRYADIQTQQLYMIQGGNILVELHMAGGTSVSVQSTMEGAYPFLDHAFKFWCVQTGRDPESCDFHDPSQSLWFPMEEV